MNFSSNFPDDFRFPSLGYKNLIFYCCVLIFDAIAKCQLRKFQYKTLRLSKQRFRQLLLCLHFENFQFHIQQKDCFEHRFKHYDADAEVVYGTFEAAKTTQLFLCPFQQDHLLLHFSLFHHLKVSNCCKILKA